MDFLKLRLAGFKSFVDATELLIEPGLTGVVGPNGCGKSNLVEAIRWVMGENSARRMRGEGMDDVIFGGTARRPPRNLAEVSLTLDNRSRTAPAAFNDAAELEVSRRIERGAGSDYRINGKSVRARDVQLLFADNATGAQSPSLVSQGKVGALINAKPGDRRQLLEEAAGISGLHSRRHEAELKLKSAEANLVRLDDVIAAMDSQFEGLKKQARQAARYRNLSEMIRRAEAVLWHLRWRAAEAESARARAAFDAAEADVRAFLLEVTQLTTRRTDAAADLPALRQDEAAAAAALQRLVLARDALDREEQQVTDARAANEQRLAQAEADLAREQALASDADQAIARLAAERASVAAACDGETEEQEAAEEAVAVLADTVAELDARLAALTDRAAADDAERSALARTEDELVRRLEILESRRAEAAGEHDRLAAAEAAHGDPALAEAEVAAAEEALELARERADTDEEARDAAAAARERARDRRRDAEATGTRLGAECAALEAVLATGTDGADDGARRPPVVDELTVAPGCEAALAVAFGDGLEAATDPAAVIHWRELPPLADTPDFPAGAEPLARHVTGPAALARALGRIGMVADDAAGQRLAGALAAGQILVTREGAAWRWDGLTVRAGAPTPAAVRLAQRNRLDELREALAVADDATAAAADDDDRAAAAAAAAADRVRDGQETVRQAFARLGRAREAEAALARARAETESRRDAAARLVETLGSDRADVEARLAAARERRAALPAAAPVRAEIERLREDANRDRTRLGDRTSALDRLRRDAAARRDRLVAIDQEVAGWRTRLGGAGARCEELTARAGAATEELARLADRPAEIAADRDRLADRIAEAERTRRRAADALAAAETGLGEVERALKAAEAALGTARETRARAEGAVETAAQALETVRERIAERLECEPADALALSGLETEDDLPDPAAVETRLERLTRDRDNMGPVNLRAEFEADELDQQITGLKSEREDLIAAIGRLRQGISTLNREARERLLGSFDTVNGHFQRLFVELFGGGRAQLELTDAEDPLAAGLEIYASPPGKRLQVLSLLSGGEQALTALALLFAVFLTNPSPICVLDEVDAPLDESNVGRFCSLVQEIAGAGGTRFLIITHHRMTMARVDRLFGVTMAEQGISQLVSVDLQGAEQLRAVG